MSRAVATTSHLSAAPPAEPVWIVDLRPGDTVTVQGVFDALSDQSRYLRFHAAMPRLSAQMLRLLTDVRPGQHVAHVAQVGAGGQVSRPVGLVRWIRSTSDPSVADFAIEVADTAQGRGVARALAGRAAESAAAAGVTAFVASVSPGNRTVRSWAMALGAAINPRDQTQLRLPVRSLLPEQVAAQVA